MNVPTCWMRSAAIELTRFGSCASTVFFFATGRCATTCAWGLSDGVVSVGPWLEYLYRDSSSFMRDGLSVC
jgi:hypothetical protein